jgi:hypothetical protein
MSHDGKQAEEEQLQWCMNLQFLVWRKFWQVEHLSEPRTEPEFVDQ